MMKSLKIIAQAAAVWTLGLLPLTGAGADAKKSGSPKLPRAIIASAKDYGQLPIVFEPNRGQAEPGARFIAHGRGYTVFLTEREAVLNLHDSAPVRIRPSCAQNPESIAGLEPTNGISNYFFGSDPSRWVTHVPNYRKVHYTGICPGVDLTFYGNPQQLEYDFILAPRTDPRDLHVEYEGVDSVRVTANGDLALKTGSQELVQRRPLAYQTIGGRRRVVEASYRLTGARKVTFALARYQRDQPLVIDPVLVYSTYLGGSGGAVGAAIAVDGNGDIYIAGHTNFPSSSLPLPGQPVHGAPDTDAYVAKISSGGILRYSNYFGGELADYATGIAVDSSGSAYVVGQTASLSFPTVQAMQTQRGGANDYDGFASKFSPDGSSLVYSTYIGGSLFDQAAGIALGTNNHAYVAGWTNSQNFVTTPGAYQSCSAIVIQNAFVVHLDDVGARVYSTCVGGSGGDAASGIAVNSGGNAYITGSANSACPTPSPTCRAFPVTTGVSNAGLSDVFVAKLNPLGTGLDYSTLIGGSGDDRGAAIALDSSGSAYITGSTASSNFPGANAMQPSYGGGNSDAFVAKLNSSGTARVYSTYLGSSGAESGNGIAVDSSGSAYVTGSYPIPGSGSVFVAKLDVGGSALVYSTYLAGDSRDAGTDIAVDGSGKAYITGFTYSSSFPTTTTPPPLQPFTGGANSNAFITVLSATVPAALSIAKTHTGTFTFGQNGAVYTLAVGNSAAGGVTAGTVVVTESIPSGLTLVSMTGSGWGCIGGICSRSDALAPGSSYPPITVTVNVAPNAPAQVTNQASVSGGGSAPANASDVVNIQARTSLAAGKAASQSSTFGGATAAKAIDGNTNGVFSNNSVSTTNFEGNAWWQLDLGASANIDTVVIWNRTDCCGARLGDYWVFISNTPFLPSETPATLQNRAGTFSNHQTSAPAPATSVAFGSAQGRYVRVQLSGSEFLSLAEVQVFGVAGTPPPNIAVGKLASQGTTFGGAIASEAVDGNTNGVFSNNSVATTNLGPNPWWQVDLGASATIDTVTIWNRTDCCGARLGDYWVFISNTPFLPSDTPATLQNRTGTFSSHQTSAPAPNASIVFGGVQGQYVRIQLSGSDFLSLAEVQVFGVAGSPPVNIAAGKPASQSTTFGTSAASQAVDGNTNGIFANNSVATTNLGANAWWQVDLGAGTTINTVAVWNRTDCCGARLSDYWVFVSNTPFGPSDTPATLQSRAGTYSSHQTSAPAPGVSIAFGGVQGRHVRVQLSGSDHLSLAEVQVFGVAGNPPVNIAAGKPASQSTTFGTSVAAQAVDGNTNGVFANNSVATTNPALNAWWEVDLGVAATIDTVAVWNRTDCCGNRLGDYWVFVSNTPFLPSDTPASLQARAGTFSSHQTSAPAPGASIPFSGVQGRYVRVQLSGSDHLSLAEVQVF